MIKLFVKDKSTAMITAQGFSYEVKDGVVEMADDIAIRLLELCKKGHFHLSLSQLPFEDSIEELPLIETDAGDLPPDDTDKTSDNAPPAPSDDADKPSDNAPPAPSDKLDD